MPRWLIGPALIVAVLSSVPFLLIARAREQTSTTTRLQPIQDMGHQPKFRAQAVDPLFADGRATRLPVDGTVARGELDADTRYFRGVESDGKTLVKEPPVPVTMELLRRGQERFGIYCAPCHGLSGYGNGMVAVRALELKDQGQAPAWTPPLSYHEQRIRDREAGSIFGTITNGVRTMPPYGSKVGVADRWAIVWYVRALQRSQHAPLEDVPPEKREVLR